MWASSSWFAGPILVPLTHRVHQGNNCGHRDLPDPDRNGRRCEQAHIGYWAGDPLRPRRHRHRFGQLDRGPPLRRPTGRDHRGGHASAAPASTSGASPRRCSSTRPTSAVTPGTARRSASDPPCDRRDWPAIRDRIFGRIDPISDSGETLPRGRLPNIDVYDGARPVHRRPHAHARPRRTGEEITADQIVIAAGSRPWSPTPRPRRPSTFHTSDTVMRLDALPRADDDRRRRFVAAEFAHVFSALGTEVTQVHRGAALLAPGGRRRRGAGSPQLAGRQWDVRLGTTVDGGRARDGRGVRLRSSRRRATLDADVLLLATGRVPNADRLDLDAAGVEVRRRRPRGRRRVPAHHRRPGSGRSATSAARYQLKHVANHEARVVSTTCSTRRPGRQRPPVRPQRGVHLARRSRASG